MSSAPTTRLIVFSDDWGRHPSSCQHLISKLLPRYPALWVNTIGTRAPGLSWGDMKKVAKKLRQWTSGAAASEKYALPPNLSEVTPRMWPGFRSGSQRTLNARLITKSVNRALGPRVAGEKRVVITTLPITADLVGRLDVDRWVYYSVDDFSVWPGADGDVMQKMEAAQVPKMDATIAVSRTLLDRLSAMGAKPALLTHGIDLSHWTAPAAQAAQVSAGVTPDALPPWWASLRRPIYLFWGLVDARLDTTWCRAIAEASAVSGQSTLVLVGPQQSPDAALATIERVVMPGPVAYEDLPRLAAAADVLVMPYADLPVTRAMQPLKFKEYLATGKPVVVRDLPATREWADAADVVATAEEFVRVVRERAAGGVPASQTAARGRLSQESWENKAREFEKFFQ